MSILPPGAVEDAQPAIWPRVLIIAPAVLNTTFGGGVTMSRLFAGWPLARIAQVHCDIAPSNLAVCETYYGVSGPFYRRPARPWLRRAGQFAGYLSQTGEHGLLWSRLSRRLRRWLDEFQPDVIFSQTSSLAFLRLTRQILDYTGARLALHASDDWVNDWPTNTVRFRVPGVSSALAATVDREYRQLVDRADLRFAISEAMAAAYAQRYGGSWQVFANPIDAHAWPSQASASPRHFSTSRPFRLFYSGTILSQSQGESLMDIVDAVEQLRLRDAPVEIKVASASPGRQRYHRPPASTVQGLVPQSELPARLAAADLLVLPVSFAASARSFIGLSMPGKVSEYLFSTTPVLAYGPYDVAAMAYASHEGWAEVVDRRDVGALQQAILRLMDDADRRAALVQRAMAVGRRDFDVNRLRPAFQSALRGLIPAVRRAA